MKDLHFNVKERTKYGVYQDIKMDIILEEQLMFLISNFLSADLTKREEILNKIKL